MLLASFSAQFTWIDWLVVFAYLALTTWIGVAMAGRQATIRDFFLGGRKLPWYAVSGSIIATEISALTFVSVPWVVFRPGGNITYLQLGLIGSLLARALVAWWLIPAYYEKEIYSPYDYMRNQLGGRVRGLTTILFTISSMLGQSARIYLTAEVLNVVMHDELVWLSSHLGLNELAWAIILLSGVSVIWTMIGGMATVIWTDVVLFLAFLIGAIVALACVAGALSGGIVELFQTGWSAGQSGVPWAAWGTQQASGPWGKFTFFDFSTDPTRAYTIWTAMIASTWGGIGAYGTDQLMAQRMFCCRNVSDARKAIVASWLANSVTVLVALVGVGLYTYYQSHTPSPDALALLADVKNGDRIFPVFIVEVIPVGLKGLIIAAIFAAAISSIMGVLTALSQTVQSAFYNPLREAALRRRGIHIELAASAEHTSDTADSEARRSVLVGRLLVLFWTFALSLMAYGAQVVASHYASLLDMGLAMAQYCGGALLAGFFLSFLPLRVDGRGYMWSAPLSVACIFAIVWHYDWAVVTCWIIGGVLLTAWIAMTATQRPKQRANRLLPIPAQAVVVLLGVAMLIALAQFDYFDRKESPTGAVTYTVLAWPWYGPAGSLIAFLWGWALASKTRPNHGVAAQ